MPTWPAQLTPSQNEELLLTLIKASGLKVVALEPDSIRCISHAGTEFDTPKSSNAYHFANRIDINIEDLNPDLTKLGAIEQIILKESVAKVFYNELALNVSSKKTSVWAVSVVNKLQDAGVYFSKDIPPTYLVDLLMSQEKYLEPINLLYVQRFNKEILNQVAKELMFDFDTLGITFSSTETEVKQSVSIDNCHLVNGYFEVNDTTSITNYAKRLAISSKSASEMIMKFHRACAIKSLSITSEGEGVYPLSYLSVSVSGALNSLFVNSVANNDLGNALEKLKYINVLHSEDHTPQEKLRTLMTRRLDVLIDMLRRTLEIKNYPLKDIVEITSAVSLLKDRVNENGWYGVASGLHIMSPLKSLIDDPVDIGKTAVLETIVEIERAMNNARISQSEKVEYVVERLRQKVNNLKSDNMCYQLALSGLNAIKLDLGELDDENIDEWERRSAPLMLSDAATNMHANKKSWGEIVRKTLANVVPPHIIANEGELNALRTKARDFGEKVKPTVSGVLGQRSLVEFEKDLIAHIQDNIPKMSVSPSNSETEKRQVAPLDKKSDDLTMEDAILDAYYDQLINRCFKGDELLLPDVFEWIDKQWGDLVDKENSDLPNRLYAAQVFFGGLESSKGRPNAISWYEESLERVTLVEQVTLNISQIESAFNSFSSDDKTANEAVAICLSVLNDAKAPFCKDDSIHIMSFVSELQVLKSATEVMLRSWCRPLLAGDSSAIKDYAQEIRTKDALLTIWKSVDSKSEASNMGFYWNELYGEPGTFASIASLQTANEAAKDVSIDVEMRAAMTQSSPPLEQRYDLENIATLKQLLGSEPSSNREKLFRGFDKQVSDSMVVDVPAQEHHVCSRKMN